MSDGKKVRWTIASARQNLPTLVSLAAHEPQDIYRRDKLVARVVSPAQSAGDSPPPPTAAALLRELQRICADEDYELPQSPRTTRPNALLAALESGRRQAGRPPRKRRRA